MPLAARRKADPLAEWRRYVALGDSLTEGVGDPGPGGRLRGWADRLAEGLEVDGFEYHNLARLGARTSDVREKQLTIAEELRPDLASVVTGMNDAISPGLDLDALHDELAAVVGRLKDMGAFVFTATLPDTPPALRLVPSRVRRRFETRLEAVSDVIRRVAQDHGVICLDAEDFPGGFRLAISSIDGLHPNARGHLWLAQMVAARLSEHAGREIEVPGECDSWARTGVKHFRWLAAGGYLRRRPFARTPG